MTLEGLKKQAICILGYGANHSGLVHFLLKQGIPLTIRDKNIQKKEQFQQEFAQYSSLVRWEVSDQILKGLEKFTLVFRSPSIPVLSPDLKKAAAKGVIIYSQTKLFFDLCPAPIIGVTGTKGKGTTASLIHAVLVEGWEKGDAYLGGNIGVDPFDFYEKLTEHDLVVLELSSFQIQDLEKSPHIAVLLTIGLDHLDHHRDVAEYEEAKAALLKHQKKDDVAIINIERPEMQKYVGKTAALTYLYSRHRPRRHSAWVDVTDNQETAFVQVADEVFSFDLTPRQLLGQHNVDNILPAVLVGRVLDIPIAKIAKSVVNFPGLEHRLSPVGTFAGVSFYEDSFATTPESAEVALEAFNGRRIHCIAGGNDKGGDYTRLGSLIAQYCVSLSLLPGTATPKLKKAFTKASKGSQCLLLDNATDPLFPTILSGIQPHLRDGDIVLMSPGATSFASFKDYKERGVLFVKAVKERYTIEVRL